MPDLCCVNVGTKYSPEYVEKLYHSAKRHSTVNYDFVVITDNPAHYQHLDVKTIPVDMKNWNNPKQGWWYKMYLFKPDLPIDNKVLYLDLDVVVVGNIDKFFDYKQDCMCICQDFNRVTIPKYHVSNSSVMYFDRNQYTHL
jgi:Glycosyl transferase family 8.